MITSFKEFSAKLILEQIDLADIPESKKRASYQDIISGMTGAGYEFLGRISMHNTRMKITRDEELVNVVPEQLRRRMKWGIPTSIGVVDATNKSRLFDILEQPYIDKVIKKNDDLFVLWNPDEMYFYFIDFDFGSTLFASYFIEIRTKGVEQALKDNGIKPENKPVNENAEWKYYVTIGDMVRCICEWGATNVDNVDRQHFKKIVDSMYDIFKNWYEHENNPIDNTPLDKTVDSVYAELLGEYGDGEIDGDIDVSDLYGWYDDIIDCFKKIPEFEEIAKTMTKEDYEEAIHDYIWDEYETEGGEYTY